MTDEPRRPTYLGRIERDPATGKVKGQIREVMSGWLIDLELEPAHSGKGYDVKGFLGTAEPPGRAR